MSHFWLKARHGILWAGSSNAMCFTNHPIFVKTFCSQAILFNRVPNIDIPIWQTRRACHQMVFLSSYHSHLSSFPPCVPVCCSRHEDRQGRTQVDNRSWRTQSPQCLRTAVKYDDSERRLQTEHPWSQATVETSTSRDREVQEKNWVGEILCSLATNKMRAFNLISVPRRVETD